MTRILATAIPATAAFFPISSNPGYFLSISSYLQSGPNGESKELVAERIVADTPVVEEQAQADGLESTGKRANGNSVERTLLREDLRDELSGQVSHFVLA